MKALFVPSVGEGRKIFPSCTFADWRYGIMKGEFKNIPVFATGVSKIPTAFSIPIIFSEFTITEAILIGVCGAYRGKGLSIGDIVSIGKDYFADEGLYYKGEFQSIAQMGGFGFTEKKYIDFDIYKGLPVADSNTVSFF